MPGRKVSLAHGDLGRELGTCPCPVAQPGTLPQPQVEMILLVPELTFLTGVTEIKKDTRMLKVSLGEGESDPDLTRGGGRSAVTPILTTPCPQDVMREMLQSPQQHYECLCSLLRRIQESQEASHELMRWGLVLAQDIHRVRASPRPGRAARCRAPPGAPPGAAPVVFCSPPDPGTRPAHGEDQPEAQLLLPR